MNGYRCIACARSLPADFSGFLCPACGGNLDITYDYASVATAVAQGFDGDGTGLFRYAPLLPVTEGPAAFPLRVGLTPLYPARQLGEALRIPGLYIKDDTQNPSASTKDRASAVTLKRAVDSGATTVAIASTGNAGSSTACLAAALGLEAIVFVPESAPVAKLTQALCYGARVLAVRGNYDDAFDLCLRAADEFGWFNRSTGYNPFTREGKKTCAFEIWEDLGRVPDYVVVPTGDGNILSGLWKGWCDLRAVGLIEQLPKMVCAQSERSAAISDTVRRVAADGTDAIDWTRIELDAVHASTIADSLSVDRPRDGLAAVRSVIESGGHVVTVPDSDIVAAIAELARATGVFAEPAAATAIAAVRRMAGQQMVGPDATVVCLVTGSGLKDVASAKTGVGEPTLIDASLEAVRASLAR